MEIKGLPGGWAAVSLSEIVEPRSGKALPSKTPDAKFIGMEHVEAHTMRLLGTVPASEMKSAANVFQKGDVLYGRLRSYLNKVYQPEFCGLCSGEFIVLPESPEVSGSFLKYRLNAMDFVAFATHINTGDRPRVDFDQIKAFQFLLPPIREQQRISDALDELLSDLDAGVEALRRAQAKLALYRASVLKAAVQGDLTAEWRKQHPDAEPAPVLLQRILVERRQRWEQEQLRKFKAAGKTPPANWKAKYKEPVAPDTTNLPPLPKGWCWASLTMLSTTETRNGISVEGSNNPLGIPALGLEAIATPVVDLRAKRFLPIPLEIAEKYAIRRGDLFIMRGNGSRRLVGKCSVAPEPAGMIVFPDTMIRYRLVSDDVNVRWIQELWQSDLLRHQLESMAKTTAGIYKLSQDDIASVAIPLAPLAEQDCCISVLHEQSSTLDHLNSYLHRQHRANVGLRQSILRHAFTGQLVPQDPNDEPASELLKRIVAEREARKKTKATPRKQTAKRQKREK